MRVELRGHDGLVGTIELKDDVAVPDEGARPLVADLTVVGGVPRRRLQFSDGLVYLEALQHNLRGTHLWATAPVE